VDDFMHPGQPGFGPGSYKQQMTRLGQGAALEEQSRQLASQESARQLERLRLEQQLAYQNAQLGLRGGQLQSGLEGKGEIVPGPNAQLDPAKFAGQIQQLPDGQGGVIHFAPYKPGYKVGAEATARAAATQRARSTWISADESKRFGIPTTGLEQDDEGNYLVPWSAVTRGMGTAASQSSPSVDKQLLQSLVDRQAEAEGKPAGGRLAGLSGDGQDAVTRAYAARNGRDPLEVARLLQAQITQSTTNAQAAAQTAMLPAPSAPPPAPSTQPMNMTPRQSPPQARGTNPPARTQSTQPAQQSPSTSGDPVIDKLTRTTSTGERYIDATGLTQAQYGILVQRAPKGLPVLDRPRAEAIQEIETSRRNSADILAQVQALLPRDASGRTVDAPGNTLARIFQTQDQLAAFNSWRAAAIQQLRAMAGSKGLRINQAEVRLAVENDIPKITDTIGTARQKLANVQRMLANQESAILGKGGEPSRGQVTIGLVGQYAAEHHISVEAARKVFTDAGYQIQQ
jgi:hypothetical protein